MEFNCTMCGICCQKVGLSVEVSINEVEKGNMDRLVNEMAKFPYKYDAAGRCENLSEDNKCMVYDTRPEICNVERIYEKHFSKQMSKQSFFSMNEKVCATLQNS